MRSVTHRSPHQRPGAGAGVGVGFTLVEVLASLVILSLVTAAVVPLLKHARQLSVRNDPKTELCVLAAAAELILAELDEDRLQALLHDGAVLIDVPEASGMQLKVELLRPLDEQADHAWVTVGDGNGVVFRWIQLPEDDPSQSPEGDRR